MKHVGTRENAFFTHQMNSRRARDKTSKIITFRAVERVRSGPDPPSGRITRAGTKKLAVLPKKSLSRQNFVFRIFRLSGLCDKYH